MASGHCGDGVLNTTTEECDDGMNVGYGCLNCTVENHYECTNINSTAPSNCTAILLDLNAMDNATRNYTQEYMQFGVLNPVFLSDPYLNGMTEYFVSPAGVSCIFQLDSALSTYPTRQ